jgi:hypothetical protein
MKTKIVIVSVLLISAQAISQNTKVIWYTLDAGSGVLASGNTSVRSSLGQMFVEASQQSDTRIASGFLVDTLLQTMLLPVKEKDILPLVYSYSLSQNYPNPFNPSTRIQYSVPSTQHVTLKVFDVLGREVSTLVDEVKPAGMYRVTWDVRGYASGMYLYRLVAGTFVETKKLLVLK